MDSEDASHLRRYAAKFLHLKIHPGVKTPARGLPPAAEKSSKTGNQLGRRRLRELVPPYEDFREYKLSSQSITKKKPAATAPIQ
jgi:hypothetical protein